MPEPYDVLFYMPWAGPLLEGSGATGGAETQVVMLARLLAAGGLNVGLLAIGDPARLPRVVDGVRVFAQRRPPRVRYLAGLINDLTALRALRRTPARAIVARTGGRSAAVAALAARLQGAGFVYSSANVFDYHLEVVDRRYNAWLFAWAVRAATVVVAQTDEQAELCRRRFARGAVVIRSIAERAAPRTATPQAFLWIGRLVSYKRLEVYLDLAARVPEARFEVIAVPGLEADPALEHGLEEARRSLPNLAVLEPRPRAELAPLLDRAVAVVNTAEWEGMPNVFLEAWARGVPVLALQHDPDGVVQRYGLGGFAAGSVEHLVELARSAWQSRREQRAVAERCIGYVRREHDTDTIVEAWRGVLARAAKR